jgi:flagellar basal-body rod protein FlgB
MDINEPTLNVALKNQMRYMSKRQGVLAQNIANIDTPKYKARDLKKVDFATMAQSHGAQLLMATPSSGKSLDGTLPDDGGIKNDKTRDAFEMRPSENNVVLEDQMGKISDTNAQFQLSSTMLKKFTQLYRTAASNK